jgi:nicotinamidase/pyrazinamidase
MNGVDTITVIGGASDFCVKMAVDGLVERNFNVEVIDNLTRGIFKQSREVFNPVDYPTVKVI